MQKIGPRREPRTIGLRSGPQAPPKKRWSFLSKVLAGFLAVATVVGGAAAVVTFLPRIIVEASEPFELSTDPPITFSVANTNVIPLEDVKPLLGLCGVGFNFGEPTSPTKAPFQVCNSRTTGIISPTTWQHSRLDMDEKFTAAWDDAVHNHTQGVVDYADIIITVLYRPWFLPWHSEKTFRFVARKLSDGKMHWFSQPMSDWP